MSSCAVIDLSNLLGPVVHAVGTALVVLIYAAVGLLLLALVYSAVALVTPLPSSEESDAVGFYVVLAALVAGAFALFHYGVVRW